MNDTTSYSKERMEELSDDIATRNQQFRAQIDQMSKYVTELENYWNLTDPDAAALYTSLNSEWAKFEGILDEGYEMISNFKTQVDSQVSSYSNAERNIRNQIG